MWVLVYRHRTTGEVAFCDEKAEMISMYANSLHWNLAGRAYLNLVDKNGNELPMEVE
jgi:hypothetical protein